jgi:hypothetical protein
VCEHDIRATRTHHRFLKVKSPFFFGMSFMDSPFARKDVPDDSKKKFDCGALLDQMFVTAPKKKKEQHKSFKFIPFFGSKQAPRTPLEDSIRLQAQSDFLNQKSQMLLNSTDLQDLWKELVEQARSKPDSNGRVCWFHYILLFLFLLSENLFAHED